MADRKLVVAVTGASGFVGRALVARLAGNPTIECRACFRANPPPGPLSFVTGEVAEARWDEALAGADVVIHTVARTHVTGGDAADSLAAYRRVNVEGTRRLAQAAAGSGVRRLVYLSSIKVNGEGTPVDRPFTAADMPAPVDAYGITKWQAEQALAEVAAASGLETVMLRPPLIHGPGVKGNLQKLIRLVTRGVPLPLKSVRNRRSMIGLDNLVGAIEAVLEHPGAQGRTFLVADPTDVSTPELIEAIAAALGRPARLWPLPPAVIMAAASMLGRSAVADRLLGSLRVDASAIGKAVGWHPRATLAEDIERMVEAEVAPRVPPRAITG